MASVTGTSVNSAADTYAALNGTGATKTTSVAEDAGNRFMTLLVTQMRNQDPLNPLDNAQVTAQLAQLNTVSGIEKLNTTLGQLLDGYNEAQGMQAAGMIGKNVMVAGKNLPLQDAQAVGAVTLSGAADKVTVTIKNANGTIVQTQELGAHEAGNAYFAWDGKDSAGNVLADGKYTFAVDASKAGKSVDSTPMQIGTVSAVSRTKDGFLLDLGAMGDVAFKDVQQIL